MHQMAAGRDAGERVGDALRGRLHVPCQQQAAGDRQRGAQVACSRVRPEHDGWKLACSVRQRGCVPPGIVVVRDDVQGDRLLAGLDRHAGATARVTDLDAEAVAARLRAVVIVGEQEQGGVGDRLIRRDGHTVVLQRAVGGQRGDEHVVAGVVRVADRQVATRSADDRYGAADQRHAGFALDQRDAAACCGSIVLRRDVDGDGLVGQQATGAVVDRDPEGVGRGRQHLVAVVTVPDAGDIAHGKGRAEAQFVAVEREHALARQRSELDDDLRLRVVRVDEAEIRLRHRISGRTVACGSAEADVATLGYRQSPSARCGRRQHRGVVLGGHGEAARENCRTARCVVDDRECQRVGIAGLRASGVGVVQAGEPRLDGSGIPGERGGAQGALANAGSDGQGIGAGARDGDVLANLAAGVLAHGDGPLRRRIVEHRGCSQQPVVVRKPEHGRRDRAGGFLQHPVAPRSLLPVALLEAAMSAPVRWASPVMNSCPASPCAMSQP